jgi:dynein heavy chain
LTGYIDSLENINTPEVFGLHSNAEIGYYTKSAKDMWEHLVELQPQTNESTGSMSREQYIENVAEDILKRIPKPFDLENVRKKFGHDISPTTVVLFQELERFNRLINSMFKSLTTLKRALKGEVGMSNELDDLARALFNGQLPPLWRKLAPATKKTLGNWMEHFIKRFSQYNVWVNDAEPNVVWLSGLHIPESYLTALVQATCRKNMWPLDRSTLYTQVTQWTQPDEVTERVHQGCFIHGLSLEGAAWDVKRGCLIKQRPKELVQELPVMRVIPIETHKLKLQVFRVICFLDKNFMLHVVFLFLKNTFRTPVYTTSDRRNAMGVGLVFEADLFTTEHLSHWVLQSVCLILNTD